MPFQRRRKLHILFASYGKRLRRQAWLPIWDRVKIPRYSHKLMHQKRVICELHDSYFRSMMIKTCHSKDGRSCIFRWPVMGREWVGVKLLYNSVHRKFRWVGEKMLDWGTCPREAGPPGPWLSSPGERERDAVMAYRVGVNMLQFCSVSNSLSHTTLSIKWEVYFSKELCRSSLLCHCYDSACICITCLYNNRIKINFEDYIALIFYKGFYVRFCCVKGEGIADPNTLTGDPKKFCSVCKNINNQVQVGLKCGS